MNKGELGRLIAKALIALSYVYLFIRLIAK